MLGRSDRTVRQWRHDFIMVFGHFAASLDYPPEEPNEKATKFVQANAAVKGQPNLTSLAFRQWANECLLPNSSGYPCKNSFEMAHKWLHELGFDVLTPSKGMFFDGHE